MSIQPTYVEVTVPRSNQVIEVRVGFAWGGDAAKDVPREQMYAFKDAVRRTFTSALEANPEIVLEMAETTVRHSGIRRYSGGPSSAKVAALLDTAVQAAEETMKPSRPCSAILLLD